MLSSWDVICNIAARVDFDEVFGTIKMLGAYMCRGVSLDFGHANRLRASFFKFRLPALSRAGPAFAFVET